MGSTSVVEIASLITANFSGDPKIRVSGVSLNSNTVEKNELFAALPGRAAHGRAEGALEAAGDQDQRL